MALTYPPDSPALRDILKTCIGSRHQAAPIVRAPRPFGPSPFPGGDEIPTPGQAAGSQQLLNLLGETRRELGIR